MLTHNFTKTERTIYYEAEIPRIVRDSNPARSSVFKFVKQRLCVFQIGGVGAVGEPEISVSIERALPRWPCLSSSRAKFVVACSSNVSPHLLRKRDSLGKSLGQLGLPTCKPELPSQSEHPCVS